MKILLVLFLIFSFNSSGQNYLKDHFGGRIGIYFNVGSHVNSIGLNVNAYYTDYFYQVNIGTSIALNQMSYGNRLNFIESRNSLGIILLAGKRNQSVDFEMDGLNHQTNYNYGLGFNYVIYKDNIGTSQLSGGFGVHLKNVAVYHENDVFGGQAKDRFRTGHVNITYRKQDFKISTGVNLWTGETAGSFWERFQGYKCKSGYRSLEHLPFGKTSHGIAYLGLKMNGPFNQIVSIKTGVDSEEIRHIVQNRLIHDLYFLSEKVKRSTPHYPRLGDDGCAVFTREDARRNKLFLQLGLNDYWAH